MRWRADTCTDHNDHMTRKSIYTRVHTGDGANRLRLTQGFVDFAAGGTAAKRCSYAVRPRGSTTRLRT